MYLFSLKWRKCDGTKYQYGKILDLDATAEELDRADGTAEGRDRADDTAEGLDRANAIPYRLITKGPRCWGHALRAGASHQEKK